ncbi:hypothetical protein IMCC1989_1982 [gamma proteobacterium IMCC1989]|nr:hypothetical protein IMCC1989_1982 [gamma proteobacterium IMCC1989]
MKEPLLLRKKIYTSLKTIKNFQLIKLQSDKNILQKNAEQAEESMKNKKSNISNAEQTVKAATESGANLDIEQLINHRKYIEKLQDDLTRETLLKRSIDKRHKDQIKKIEKNYGQSKLYDKLIIKNNCLLVDHLEKNEQKTMDDMGTSRKQLLSVSFL